MYQSASLLKRFMSCVYELLLLLAIWMLCTFVYVVSYGAIDSDFQRFCLQGLMWMVPGMYFIWCWSKTGQTLAAQAWKIKLVNAQNMPLTLKQAILRYVLASLSFLILGLGFFWALVDKDHLFFHDRILNTRFILNNQLAAFYDEN